MKTKTILSLALVAVLTLFTLTGCITVQPAATQVPDTAQPPAATQQPLTQQQPAMQQPAVTQVPPVGQQFPAGQQPPATPQPPVIIHADEDYDEDEGDVTAIISSSSGLSITEGETYMAGTIVVKVTNETAADVEDVELEVTLEADEDISDIGTATITGGGVTWILDDLDDTTLVFSNSSGLDVEEGSYEKFSLTLYVYFDDEVEDDIEFEAEVDLTDYN